MYVTAEFMNHETGETARPCSWATPHHDPRGTFIINGTERSCSCVPGVY